MASWIGAPTGWRITCARSALARRRWWGCALRAGSTYRRAHWHPQGRRRLSAARSHYPQERLAFMLADAGARVLVTHSALMEQLPAQASRNLHSIVRLDADAAAIAAQPAGAPAIDLDPQHPAYVIYTSGSTGTPKAVGVLHAGIPNLASAQIDRFAIGKRAVSAVRLPEFRCLDFGDCDSFAIGCDPHPAASGAQRSCSGALDAGAEHQPCDLAAGAAARLT